MNTHTNIEYCHKKEHLKIKNLKNKLYYVKFVGKEYLEYNGDEPELNKLKPRLYEMTLKERCPVNVYKTYLAKRPHDWCNRKHPFYLATYIAHSPLELSDACYWFQRCPMGHNKLNAIFKNMTKQAGLNTGSKSLASENS